MSLRILIVANRTLASDELMAAVEERVRGGATELLVVVPAGARRNDYSSIGFYEAGASHQSEWLTAAEEAEKRLDAALKAWAGLGISVSGELADIDAFTAVGHVLARQGVDEIIVSTQPSTISHWLRTDLPSRLHRKHQIPVSTVTARKAR
jgi:hypothetical protein